MKRKFLQQLEKSALGPSINNLYVGGFLHADDIRTLANSLDVLEAQVSLVQEFAKENFLKLNSRKQVTRMHLTQNAK